MRHNTALSRDQIFKMAPSVLAETPYHDGVSDKYRFIPTTQVLETLEGQGWKPVMVSENRVRIEGKRGFQKHMIRLRNTDAAPLLGDSHAEIVLTNSHDGMASFKMDAGLYRLVCSNGLVVSDGVFEAIRLKHVGFQDTQVIDAVHSVINTIPLIEENMRRLKAIDLEPKHKLALAKAALTLKYEDNEAPIEAADLLRSRRYGDEGNSAWATLNVVQENIIRGGLRMKRNDYTQRRNSTRAVASITENIRLNKALWVLTEELVKAVA